ncbi:MAG: glycosyltransferase [Paenibacillaceae bacterium]
MPNRIRQRKLSKKTRIVRKSRVKRKGSAVSSAPNWGERAYAAGCYAAGIPLVGETDPHKKVNLLWNDWYSTVQRLPRHIYHPTAHQFIKGYCQQTGQHANKWVLVPTNKTVSVIITVMNEKDTIPSILEQLHRLPLHEIIFVLNGSTDESFEIIRNQSWATIIHYHDPLGHDVGRAIGAKLSESDILIFLDGDFPVYAEHLVPFIESVEQGMDIALNNITPYIGLFSDRDEVTTIKEFVNMSMERVELEANSLTAVPHAMSRHAAEVIGYTNLAVPPKAQVIAMNMGLKVSAPIHVDVISRNRIRQRNVGSNNKISELIIGDHIEAIKQAMDWKGPRLTYPDHIRNRKKA